MSEGVKADQVMTEFLGGQAMLETLFGVLLTHIAELTQDPKLFVGQVMTNAEYVLERALKEASAEDRAAAEVAMKRFQAISPALIFHIMPPDRSGEGH